MPYKMRKLPRQNKYRVYNAETKRIISYGTTKTKAKKQIRLLNAIKYGNFKPDKR